MDENDTIPFPIDSRLEAEWKAFVSIFPSAERFIEELREVFRAVRQSRQEIAEPLAFIDSFTGTASESDLADARTACTRPLASARNATAVLGKVATKIRSEKVSSERLSLTVAQLWRFADELGEMVRRVEAFLVEGRAEAP